MIRTCTLKIRTSRRRANQARLSDVLEQLRMLYNGALEERKEAYRKQGKTLSYFDQCKELTQLRAEDSVFAELNCEMLRLSVLKRLDGAYKSFFRRVKKGNGKPVGFPRFRGKGRFDTIVFGETGWKLRGTTLEIKSLGLSFKLSNKIHRKGEGAPKSLRLVKRSNHWEAQIILNCGEAPALRVSSNPIGIDVGLSSFATFSTGEKIENPRFVKQSSEKLARAQRELSSKKKDSKNRAKARLVVSKIHEKIRNQRKNFVWQVASYLSKKFDGFAVEKLQIQELLQVGNPLRISSSGLRRSIMDAAWRQFVHALSCKAEEAGMRIAAVDPKGTTQNCSGCGKKVPKALSERIHNCPHCGLVLDRDHNAAVNILRRGFPSSGTPQVEVGSKSAAENFL